LRIVDRTLPVAERLELTRETTELLVTRGAALAGLGRPREGTITLIGAVAAASAAGLPGVELRARVNLSFASAGDDPQLAYRTARDGLDLALKLGMQGYRYYLLGNAAELAIRMGDWDWALPELGEALARSDLDFAARMRRAELLGLRGDDTQADLQRLADEVAGMTELQAQSSVGEARAVVALARGETRAALDLAQAAYRTNRAPDGTSIETAIRAAALLGDAEAVTDALREIEGTPGRVTAAIRREGRAALAAIAGRRHEAVAGFLDAARRWDALGLLFEAAVARLTLVSVLGSSDPEARAGMEEARVVFERVGAAPLLDRLADATSAGRSSVAVPEAPADGGLTEARAGQPRAEGG
jgi:hypothetical protein